MRNLNNYSQYFMNNQNLLCKIGDKDTFQLVIPKTMINTILQLFHDTPLIAHKSFDKTFNLIKTKYYWQFMARDIKNYIKACMICATRKSQRPANIAPLEQPKPLTRPNQKVSLDCVGKISPPSNGYYLCIHDDFTKLITLVPLIDLSARSVAEAFFTKHIALYGCPEILICDNAKNFLSQLMNELCHIMKIERIKILPYHPQINNNERVHSTVYGVISKLINETGSDWSDMLIFAQMSHNFTVHASHGFTPVDLTFGYKAHLPIPEIIQSCPQINYIDNPDYPTEIRLRMNLAYKKVQENLAHARQTAKLQYDKKSKYAQKFVNNQLVLLSNPRRTTGLSPKLDKKFIGPYVINSIINNVAARLSHVHTGTVINAHVNRLKPIFDRNGKIVLHDRNQNQELHEQYRPLRRNRSTETNVNRQETRRHSRQPALQSRQSRGLPNLHTDQPPVSNMTPSAGPADVIIGQVPPVMDKRVRHPRGQEVYYGTHTKDIINEYRWIQRRQTENCARNRRNQENQDSAARELSNQENQDSAARELSNQENHDSAARELSNRENQDSAARELTNKESINTAVRAPSIEENQHTAAQGSCRQEQQRTSPTSRIPIPITTPLIRDTPSSSQEDHPIIPSPSPALLTPKPSEANANTIAPAATNARTSVIRQRPSNLRPKPPSLFKILRGFQSVSYTHLTLPTNREV